MSDNNFLSGEDVSELVDNIVKSYSTCEYISKFDGRRQPDKEIIVGILDNMRKVIFPGYFDKKQLKPEFISYHVGELVEEIKYNLERQMVFAYSFTNGEEKADAEKVAKEKTAAFLKCIPSIRDYLNTDVLATYEGDPAAYSFDEIIYSYPGIYAIMIYRVAHELYNLSVPLIPRIMTEHAHSCTGIDIHPGATIGKYFCIDHGTGIVIGETTIIGEWVKMYQGVTLGGLSTSGGQQLKGVRRHPTIKDRVTIYAGASILGGETVIGEGTVVGGNAFITQSVDANTRVTVKDQELNIKSKSK